MASKPDPDHEEPEKETMNYPVGSEEPLQIPFLELNPEDEKDVKEWFGVASKITIMVTGETGVGKSTLLNALVGHPIFETGRSKKQAVTKNVTECKCKKDDIEIVAIDCPGLHDGTDNEDMYLQEMYDKISAHGGINLLLYCKKMTDTRADAENDADVITKLTNKLGRGIWQHAIFVLTFANVYEKVLKQRYHKQADITDQFKQKRKEWEKHIGETLKKCGIDRGECHIKVCAAGFKQPQLCGKSYWLSDFWASAYKVQDENGALALLRLNQSRIVDNAPKESFKQGLHAQPLVKTKKLKKALGTLATVGAIGTAAGAAVGATIGAVCIGVISFGPAAGAGLVIGGVVGTAIGSSIGGAIFALYNRRKEKQKAAAAKKLNK
jgi:GTP-binding protein EngB required for normal cell division